MNPQTPAARPACVKCAGGFRTADEHGNLKQTGRRDDNEAPIEHYWTSYVCTACGRRWEIETMGDSHHGYSRSVCEIRG